MKTQTTSDRFVERIFFLCQTQISFKFSHLEVSCFGFLLALVFNSSDIVSPLTQDLHSKHMSIPVSYLVIEQFKRKSQLTFIFHDGRILRLFFLFSCTYFCCILIQDKFQHDKLPEVIWSLIFVQSTLLFLLLQFFFNCIFCKFV